MTPTPARITENTAALRGLEDVWCVGGAIPRNRSASHQRAGRMSDGLCLVVLYSAMFNVIVHPKQTTHRKFDIAPHH